MEPTTVTRTYMTGDTLNKEAMCQGKKSKKKKKKISDNTFGKYLERHGA